MCGIELRSSAPGSVREIRTPSKSLTGNKITKRGTGPKGVLSSLSSGRWGLGENEGKWVERATPSRLNFNYGIGKIKFTEKNPKGS